MAVNKRGRKEKLFPQQEIDKIIYEYAERNKVMGQLKYLDVYKYSLELYENKEIPHKFSEDFWRKPFRQGRESIDKFNKSIKGNVVSTKSREISIVNIEDVVYKHHKDLDKMIKLLKPLEIELYKSIERENEANEKLNEIKSTITVEKREKQELLKTIDKLQTLLFQMFEYSADEDVPLPNMLRTGKTRHKIVENALANVFRSPDAFYEMFEKRKATTNSKVIDLQEKKSEGNTKSLADDYNF